MNGSTSSRLVCALVNDYYGECGDGNDDDRKWFSTEFVMRFTINDEKVKAQRSVEHDAIKMFSYGR